MVNYRIKKTEEGAVPEIEGNPSAELDLQEMLDLSEALRTYVLKHAHQADAPPLRTVTVGDTAFKVTAADKPDFWDKVDSGNWEPETFKVFDRFIDRDTVFLDVGAWIGSTALYAAPQAKETHAFEPDPVAFEQLQNNLRANENAAWADRVVLHPEAIAPKSGSMEMGCRNKKGDSMSSALLSDGEDSWNVKTKALGTFVSEQGLHGEKLFLKIDIEGGEYILLPALCNFLKRENCAVFLSLHPEFLLEQLRASVRGPFREIRVRAAFWKKHRTLLKALRFAKVTHTNGKPLKRTKALVKALLFAEFTHGLLAYDG